MFLNGKNKIRIGIVCILLLGTVCVYRYYSKTQSAIKLAKPVPVVQVTTAKQITWISSYSAIGTIIAKQGTSISSQVSGIISRVDFHSGQKVKKGDLLVTLKHKDLKATLSEDKAKYDYAADQFKRYQLLAKKGIVSLSDLGQTKATMDQLKAQLSHDTALLHQTIIRAPFSGQLGVSHISLGQYVTPGQALVSLQDRSTLYVDFSVPERLADLVTLERPVAITANQSKQYHWNGVVSAFGATLNDSTRNLTVRARILPPYQQLTPGMYVTVALPIGAQLHRIIIPQQAIIYNPYGNSVYVFHNGKVTERQVTIGENTGTNMIVTKGLKQDEQVVIAGQDKLFDGAMVRIGAKP